MPGPSSTATMIVAYVTVSRALFTPNTETAVVVLSFVLGTRKFGTADELHMCLVVICFCRGLAKQPFSRASPYWNPNFSDKAKQNAVYLNVTSFPRPCSDFRGKSNATHEVMNNPVTINVFLIWA